LFSSIISISDNCELKCTALCQFRMYLFVIDWFSGASWPAIHPMTAVWIPPMDRSKFMSNMMASSLGAALTMPACGFLISYIGWESVFYFTGGLGLIWSICWFVFVFETPARHPRISPEERNMIEEAIGTTTSKKRPSRVPWAQMLTSAPVWAIIITHGCSVFGYFTVVNQLPSYMKYILEFNIKEVSCCFRNCDLCLRSSLNFRMECCHLCRILANT
jgi:MFS transporter, ACS family, solute carrier family 17 (sodium-dependent inorganic phosphate cotransporter), other